MNRFDCPIPVDVGTIPPIGRKRRTHSPEYRTRIALEALKGIKPIHQIASENKLHPVQVSQRKKEIQERMAELFGRKNAHSK